MVNESVIDIMEQEIKPQAVADVTGEVKTDVKVELTPEVKIEVNPVISDGEYEEYTRARHCSMTYLSAKPS
jgi:hypothetical protein